MKRIPLLVLCGVSAVCAALAQTPQKPTEEKPPEVVRITTALVQTDVVVTDKNDQIVPDLKLEDFELFENGRKQALQFVEFIGTNGTRRAEALSASAKTTPGVGISQPRELTIKDVKRAIAFVIDDVTIPNEDFARVREMLSLFIDQKMQDGDLVAIVRTVSGSGVLDQFTSDRQILRRAIAQIGVRSIPPYLAFGGPDPGRVTKPPGAGGVHETSEEIGSMNIDYGQHFEGPGEGVNQVPRALQALTLSNLVVESLREIPGRKNLILLSGGLPLFDLTTGGSLAGDVCQLFRQITDNATRSGVVINTMDVRGLKTSGAAASFVETPAKSALGGGTFGGSDEKASFGREVNTALLGDKSATDLTLRWLAGHTGGVSVVDSNNFGSGLDRVLSRSRGYYRLTYKPSEKFDNKFHKVEVKLQRSGIHVYAAEGYYAREEKAEGSRTKEEQIMAAARSPLAKRELAVTAELQYTFTANNHAQLNIDTVIDAHKLNYTHTSEGKYHAAFDVAGFVFDQFGHLRGGPSQRILADLTQADYQRALATGIGYTASTLIPPGYYQMRLVVREVDTGNIGTVSRYFEVPDLSNKQLAMSSILLYEKDPAVATDSPLQLSATRVISRKQDLRYATVVYNARQATSRLIISQGNKMLFQEAEEPLKTAGSGSGQVLRVGQLALSKVAPGHYMLTLVITDPQADKKHQQIWRSVDFTVVD